MKPQPESPIDDDEPFDALVVKPVKLALHEGETETYRQAQTRIREAQALQRRKYQRSIPAKKRQ